MFNLFKTPPTPKRKHHILDKAINLLRRELLKASNIMATQGEVEYLKAKKQSYREAIRILEKERK